MKIDALTSTLDTSIGSDATKKTVGKQGLSFIDAFKDAVDKVNSSLVESEKAGLDMATGKNGNIHEAMLKMNKADIEMRMMVSTVNKLVEGYNELMRLR